MQISVISPTQEESTRAATTWLLTALDSPTFQGGPLPPIIRGYLYVNGKPTPLYDGYWAINNEGIYLARVNSSSASVSILDRLAVLAAVANLMGAASNDAIIEKIAGRLVTCLKDSTREIYANIIQSTRKPSRLAIDNENYRVATELEGRWYLSGGAPIEVNDRWIIMDF